MVGEDNKGYVEEIDINNPKSNALKESHLPIEVIDSRKSIEAEEYDPYKWREVKHPTTNLETLVHLLKSSFGTGILAMPLAFYHSGYLLGIITTGIIGFICAHCIQLLIRCQYEVCRRKKVSKMSYPETAQACLSQGPSFFKKFEKVSPHIVNVFLVTYQLGIGTVYTVFIAENIEGVLASNDIHVDARYLMLASLLPLVLINFIRNLKFLAPFSSLANVITFISFGIIAYYMFTQEFTFEGKEPLGMVKDYPLFFGTVLFALESIGVIMPLENEMKTPQHFVGMCGVLNIGMIIIVLLYAAMGFFGYIAYGKEVGGSISYTIGNGIPAQVCKVMLSFAVYITHALQLYPAIDTLCNDYLLRKYKKGRTRQILEYLIRTMIVVVTVCLAIAVPYIDLFISLFGALTISALGIAIPALLDICTYWYTLKGISGTLRIVKNCVIISIGIFGLIVGTFTSLEKIIEKFTNTTE